MKTYTLYIPKRDKVIEKEPVCVNTLDNLLFNKGDQYKMIERYPDSLCEMEKGKEKNRQLMLLGERMNKAKLGCFRDGKTFELGFTNSGSSDVPINLFDGDMTSSLEQTFEASFAETSTVATAASPFAITYSPIQDNFYVATGSNITVINAATESIVTTFAIASLDSHLAYDSTSDRVWFRASASSLQYIDCSTNTLSATFAALGGTTWGRGIAHNPNDNTILNTGFQGITAKILKYDISGATPSILTISGSAGTNANNPCVVDVGNNRLYYQNGTSLRVMELSSGATGGLLLTTGSGVATGGLTYSSANNLIYAGYDDGISFIDLTTKLESNFISIPSTILSNGIAFNTDLNVLYFSDGSTSNTMYTVDAVTGSIGETTSVSGNRTLYGAYSPTSGKAIFSLYSSSSVAFFSSGSSVSITNGSGYDFMNRGIRSNPIILCGIMVISSNSTQLNQTIPINTLDASGEGVLIHELASMGIDQYQKQSSYSWIDLAGKDVIFNGNESIEGYVLKAGASVRFVFYYRDFKVSDLLGPSIFKGKWKA